MRNSRKNVLVGFTMKHSNYEFINTIHLTLRVPLGFVESVKPNLNNTLSKVPVFIVKKTK